MSNINYEEIFDEAFKTVKTQRDASEEPSYTKIDAKKLFDIKTKEFSDQTYYINVAYEEFYQAIRTSMMKMLKVISDKYIYIVNVPIFAFVDISTSPRVLYYLKEWGLPQKNDEKIIKDLLDKNVADDYKRISLVEENAESYLFRIGKKTNYAPKEITLKEFYSSVGKDDEYSCLKKQIDVFQDKVESYLSYITVTNLTPNATYELKYRLEKEILDKTYTSILTSKLSEGIVSESLVSVIDSHFYNKAYYKSILSGLPFSESLLTAEWMYQNMANARRADLTVVALGYFKAVEQFLFDFILLHKNEGKTIKRMYHKNGESNYVILDNDSIKEGLPNFMLDSMIRFIDFYKAELFDLILERKDIEYIKNEFDKLKKIRNGFLHKDNMHDISTVEKAKEKSLHVIALLLGTLNFRKSDLEAFKIKDVIIDQEQRLYQYFYYNSFGIYILKDNGQCSKPFVVPRTKNISYDENGNTHFPKPMVNFLSGYENGQFKKDLQLLNLNEETEVYEGDIKSHSGEKTISIPCTLIFKNGRFVK